MKPVTVSVTLATASTTVASNWVVLDRFPASQHTTLYVQVSGSATYSVQHTPQNVGEVGASGAPVYAVSGMSAKTTADFVEFDTPAGAVRLVAAAASANEGSVSLTVIQAGS